MKESIRLPEKQRIFLEKIEHVAKTFLKTDLVFLYYSIHIEEAETKVVKVRSAIYESYK